VQKIKVDVVGLETVEGAFAGGDHVWRGRIPRIDLGGQEYAVASLTGKGAAKDGFGAPVGIHFGGVEMRKPEVAGVAQGGNFGRCGPWIFSHMPRADADLRHRHVRGMPECNRVDLHHALAARLARKTSPAKPCRSYPAGQDLFP
jgi:hypothetical protein